MDDFRDDNLGTDDANGGNVCGATALGTDTTIDPVRRVDSNTRRSSMLQADEWQSLMTLDGPCESSVWISPRDEWLEWPEERKTVELTHVAHEFPLEAFEEGDDENEPAETSSYWKDTRDPDSYVVRVEWREGVIRAVYLQTAAGRDVAAWTEGDECQTEMTNIGEEP